LQILNFWERKQETHQQALKQVSSNNPTEYKLYLIPSFYNQMHTPISYTVNCFVAALINDSKKIQRATYFELMILQRQTSVNIQDITRVLSKQVFDLPVVLSRKRQSYQRRTQEFIKNYIFCSHLHIFSSFYNLNFEKVAKTDYYWLKIVQQDCRLINFTPTTRNSDCQKHLLQKFLLDVRERTSTGKEQARIQARNTLLHQ
jgi:hypothetical protein